MSDITQEQRDAAAESYLEDSFDGPAAFDDCMYGLASDLLILTDDEADRRATENIRESVWAFETSFLNSYMPEGVDAADFDEFRKEKCEGANAALLALIGDRFEEFASDAIEADGRGHFLSSWDGAEIEFEYDGRTWYAYRN